MSKLSRLVVAVADPNPHMRQAVRALLARLNVLKTVEIDDAQAIAEVRAHAPVDALIVGGGDPSSALDMVRAWRRAERDRDARAAVIVALDDVGAVTKADAKAAGAAGVTRLPLTVERLRAALDESLTALNASPWAASAR